MPIKILKPQTWLPNLFGTEGGQTQVVELSGASAVPVVDVYRTGPTILLTNEQTGLISTQLAWKPINVRGPASLTRLPPGYIYQLVYLDFDNSASGDSHRLDFQYVDPSGAILSTPVVTVAAANIRNWTSGNLKELMLKRFGVARPGLHDFNTPTTEGFQLRIERTVGAGAGIDTKGMLLATPFGAALP